MPRWYMGKLSEDTREITKRKILSLIPPEPSKIRMKELVIKACEHEPKINRSTIWRWVNQFVKDGVVRRILTARERVHYQRTYLGKNELALSEIRRKSYEIFSDFREVGPWEKTSKVFTELGIIEISVRMERIG
ncbi:MAG: hypothetical protein OEX77_00860 [Candidatus Bathyarchaeota archaeon]|nr:hypothetical protein [Candidatus Bathyarchaeota archaeon]MDH5732441.1 hypothetical protein [Candidatus Bathyarchaeota archaeon]